MGKKRSVIIGSPQEEELKVKRDIQRQQKKLREGKTAKVSGMGGGQRVVDSSQESLSEYEERQKRLADTTSTLTSSSAPSSTPLPKKASKTRSKAYTAAKSRAAAQAQYDIPQALTLLRQVSLSKFDPTVELHLVLNSKPSSHPRVALPHSAGKTKKVAVVTDTLLNQIAAGKIDFDVLVATPADMSKLVKFAKVLGPKGLMPNPKSGTISDKPQDTAKKLAADTTSSLKLDKSGPVIHTSVGKLSLKDSQLQENIAAVIATVNSSGIKKVILKSTISPAIKLSL